MSAWLRRGGRARRAWLVSVLLLVVVFGAARAGCVSLTRENEWFDAETSSQLGPRLEGQGTTVLVSALAVLVLDDHPVAAAVGEALAGQLRGALPGLDVRVHHVARAPWRPEVTERVDVLALVDRVHVDADDWGLYQRAQVRLNVAIGRPARALNDSRRVAPGPGQVLDLAQQFYFEYSIDGHFEQAGLMAHGAHFDAAAAEIAEGLARMLARAEWRMEPAPEALPPARVVPQAEFVPTGEVQPIYDVVRFDGARETLLQVTTVEDWRAALADSRRRAFEAGWVDASWRSSAEGDVLAFAVERADVRIEFALAYMQGTVRDASEQLQMLTVLQRVSPVGAIAPEPATPR